MKKAILAGALGAMLAISAVGLAKVPADQVALAGIAPGVNIESVKAALGEPTYAGGETLSFANGLVVKVDEDRPGIVEEVIARQAGLSTPGGVSVGMSEGVLNDAYGKADRVDRDYDDTEYTYLSEDRTKKIEFKVVGGFITKISCELRD